VFVEGDSVLSGTYTTMPDALVGWNVTMDAVGSRRLTQAIPILQARRAEIGRVLVIQMGNNYIPGEGGSFASQIDQTMQIVAGVDRVVWITVAEVNGASRVAINNDIRDAATRYPNIVVAEWAPLVAAHPDYAPGDALHLSAQGRIEMANLVAAAVGPAP
jgi:lysophospholipase L1-like esterase